MRLLSFILMVITTLASFGINHADSVNVYFSVGRHNFDPSLGNNRVVMSDFIKKIKEAAAAGDIDSIIVYGYASPEGRPRANARLARNRCTTIASYISAHAGVAPSTIDIRPAGIGWKELRRLVAANPDVPHRREVLDILDNTPVSIFDARGLMVDGRKKQLMDLAGGRPWRWMLVHLFPEVRNAVAISLYRHPLPAEETGAEAEATAEADSLASVASAAVSTNLSSDTQAGTAENNNPENTVAETGNADINGETVYIAELTDSSDNDQITCPGDSTPFYHFAIKTNAVYYAALLPNLEFEWLINENWSVAVEGNLAWWGKYKNERSYRLAVFDAEGRRWFKTREPWHGMYAGVIAGGGIYDLEKGTPGHHGWGVMTGLTFGYMWPIGRHLSLEAEIGAGYMYTRYKDYQPLEGHHVYLSTKEMNYFGPIKLSFSIVWRFFDYNKPKHGGPAR